MKRAIAIGTMLAFVASQALAAAPACDNTGKLSAARLTMMLPGKYVCVGSFPNATWNELHGGAANNTGTIADIITDYKKGPGSDDPEEQVGTYNISGGADGQVQYNYGSGGVYSFYVKPITLSTTSTLLFCPKQTGMDLIVNVQSGHC